MNFVCAELLINLSQKYIKVRLGEELLVRQEQSASVNDVKSDIRILTHSVPQGSNLGPLLFLIFIYDLPKCNDYFKCVMFADDCTLSCAVPSQYLHNAHVDINRNLVSVNRWLCANKIQVNVQKTKYVIYSYRGQLKLKKKLGISWMCLSQALTIFHKLLLQGR